MHQTSITVVGVPFQVSGDVRFRLEGSKTPNVLAVAEASFTGTMDFIPSPNSNPSFVAVPYTATMTGTYDCKTKKLVGKLENGKFSDPDAVSFFRFSGTYTGALGASGFTGTWHVEESTAVTYAGNGDFSAKKATP
jgi:hypothetical protein